MMLQAITDDIFPISGRADRAGGPSLSTHCSVTRIKHASSKFQASRNSYNRYYRGTHVRLHAQHLLASRKTANPFRKAMSSR